MDIDAYVATHRGDWQRRDDLLRRGGGRARRTGEEVDELVELYQRVATRSNY
jgi:hypothetical protein